ncbi:hypothetical protein D3C72_1374250 [compost metagenome]
MFDPRSPSAFARTNDVNEKKVLLLAQGFITMMMAFCMSGVMSLIALGPTSQWLHEWPKAFIIAWPIAFGFTRFVGPLGFKMAYRVMGLLSARAAR